MIKTENNYTTPDWLYNALNKMFGPFDFDPCPLRHDIDLWDGRTVDWKSNNFVNPPFSPAKLKESFIKKGFYEWNTKGHRSVFLIPASLSTEIYHDFIVPLADAVMAVRGRPQFGLNGKPPTGTGMRDLMIVLYGDYLPSCLHGEILTIEFDKEKETCVIKQDGVVIKSMIQWEEAKGE